MATTVFALATIAAVGALVLTNVSRGKKYAAGPSVGIHHTNAMKARGNHGAYVLHNTVTHARLVPTTAKHNFTYPTIALLLPLLELEAGELDLCRGWLLGYGGISWRVCGLRADGYLFPELGAGTSKRGIRQKLVEIMRREGYADSEFGDAWMLTMPAYCGFEGINPLSVYYCYRPDGEFYMAVLEIHNTFSEAHVHFLRIGSPSTTKAAAGYAYQWTFPRDFHVSPFNDRSGYYSISLTPPSRPPPSLQPKSSPALSFDPPAPKIRIHQLESLPAEPSTPGPLKLIAIQNTRSAVPLTSGNLLRTLAARPFVLLLSMVRISYHAWILHYRKGLDVHVRPEPVPTRPPLVSQSGANEGGPEAGIGVKFQEASALEHYSRKKLEVFFSLRARETGVKITLISANALQPPILFFPSAGDTHEAVEKESSTELTIWYRSPQFFSLLFACPTPWHALALGAVANDDFTVSSEQSFLSLFPSASPSASYFQRLAQRMRYSVIPEDCQNAFPWRADVHWLDVGSTPDVFRNVWMLAQMLFASHLEAQLYALVRARFVKGQEPWERWQRAAHSERVKEWVQAVPMQGAVVR